MLDDIRVLDFTIAMAGPLATQRLAELGAEIIKVEHPATGDLTRAFAVGGARIDGSGAAYFALNHNKKSIALDLKSKMARPVLERLIASVDVIVQNFRPGVAERLGIDYDSARSIRPDIVYASISGYGWDGPLADAPGQDLLVQSFSGLTFNAGRAGAPPHPSPVFLIDTTTSHLATSAVLAALHQRSVKGVGEHVKVSLLGAALEMQSQELAAFSINGQSNARVDGDYASAWLDPPYGIYQTADGWIAFAQNNLGTIAQVLDNDALGALAKLQAESGGLANTDEWRAWREDVWREMSTAMRDLGTMDVVDRMSQAGIWCGPVQDYKAMIDHPQTRPFLQSVAVDGDRNVMVPRCAIATASATLPEFRYPPRLGADTDSVLSGVGYSPDELAALRVQGAFG